MPNEDGTSTESTTDSTESVETVEETAAAADGTTPPEGETPAEGESTEESGEKPSPETELPEWAQGELKKVRGEAANYRTKLREVEKQLSEAKTPEEFESVRTELGTRIAELEHEILRSAVATEHKLPKELAAVLKGSTEEELTEHAKVLAKYAPVTEPDPESLSGGLNPGDGDDGDLPDDPRALALKARGGRRR